MHESKTSEKTISEYFGKGVLVFLQESFTCLEEFSTQKIGGRYYKFRLNGSEGFNKIFGIGISKILLAVESEGNCIS